MMFTKSTDKLESLIGANSTFKGDINSRGTLRVDGHMTGNVNADWVIIGEKATLKGDIVARGIVVAGRVEGNLRSKEIVEIKTKGQVVGDVAAAKLTILEGGLFEGRSIMNKSDSKIVELQQRG